MTPVPSPHYVLHTRGIGALPSKLPAGGRQGGWGGGVYLAGSRALIAAPGPHRAPCRRGKAAGKLLSGESCETKARGARLRSFVLRGAGEEEEEEEGGEDLCERDRLSQRRAPRAGATSSN